VKSGGSSTDGGPRPQPQTAARRLVATGCRSGRISEHGNGGGAPIIPWSCACVSSAAPSSARPWF